MGPRLRSLVRSVRAGWSTLEDLESDIESILWIAQWYAPHLRDRIRDAEGIHDEDERPGKFPFQAGRARAGEDPQASRGRPVEVHEQIRRPEIHRYPQVEVLVRQRKSQDGRAVHVDHAATESITVERDPRVPLAVDAERPMLAHLESRSELHRNRCLVDRPGRSQVAAPGGLRRI